VKPTEVNAEDARRIAVRAQLLDGSATDVLSTVRRLGFLQLDPISSVAPPQHLVLWSRLGSAYDRSELDRLLWETKQLFEWNAFLWPIEDLPLLRARMRSKEGSWARYRATYLKETHRFAGTCCASSSGADRCSPARSRTTSRPERRLTAGGVSARWA
jgi:uncharacterized protein YcaQ